MQRLAMELLPPDHSQLARFNLDDPDSLVNLLPKKMQEHILNAVKREPRLFDMDEPHLKAEIKPRQMPTTTDNVLRMRFWTEYDVAMAHGRKMAIENVHCGICHRDFFYGRYLGNHIRVAWMLCPPIQYELRLRELLDFGMESMRDVLEMSHLKENGEIDIRILNLKAKVFAMIDMRVNGAPTQRLEQRSLSINVNASDRNAVLGVQGDNAHAQLEAKLRELEARERKALHLPEPRLAEWQTMPVTGKDVKDETET